MLYGMETVALTRRQEAELGGGGAEDAKICNGSDEAGQNQEHAC